jgi:uncharacterized protein YjbJ (UPF0337 family)
MEATNFSFNSKWYELKSQVRETFPKLTADDVEHLTGGMDDLAGMVQQRYHYTRSQADIDVNNWLRAIATKSHARV